jgi:uncharacterized Zn-finger protein
MEFDTHKSLLAHYRTHVTTYPCNLCDHTALTKTSLARHIVITHMQKKFACKICKKTYANKSTLTQHIRSVHNGVKIYMCIECSERFSDYASRMTHMIEVHGLPARTYMYPNCSKEFSRSGRLSEHIRRDHIKIKSHTCPSGHVCDLKFFTEHKLKVHSLRHSGEERLFCFDWTLSLIFFLIDIMNFHCDVCGKSYARKETLTEHMKIHKNVRAHVCHVCGKDFIQECTADSRERMNFMWSVM